jgi:protease PrsW
VRYSYQLFRAVALLIAGLLLFVALAYLLDVEYYGEPISLLPAIGVAIIPAVLWMVFFYLQDYKAPEPKHYVAGIFLLGAFVAYPVANFLTDDLLGVPSWLHSSQSLNRGAQVFLLIAAVGMSQEFMKYAVVRYTVYLSKEFDEPVDGIVYSTAAGLGFATRESLTYVIDLGGVHLTFAAVNVVIRTLAHACFAGVVGYFLGQAKFMDQEKKTGILVLGVALAALLNGSFALLQESVTRQGFSLNLMAGLLASAVFAGAVFAVIFFLMQRQVAKGAP